MSVSGPDKYIIAIDHGTSGLKTALVSTRGEIAGFEFEKTPIHFLPGGGAEQAPEDWWSALLNTTRRLVERNIVPVDDIVAVCCSSTFSSTVAVDSAGEPLMNSLTWMDSRGAQYIDRHVKGLINVEGYSLSKALRWISRTGGAPALSGNDDMGHVLYWKHARPDIYKRVHMFLGSKDFLNFRLSGKFSATYDSVSLFWIADTRDINNVHYDPGIMKMLGVDPGKFPPLMKSTAILGDITPAVAEATGLSKNVKVIAGSPDLQSACIGSGAVRDFDGHVYIGTSSWILCHVPFKKTDIFHVITSLPSSIPGKYFCANEQDTAGGCMNFLIENLLYEKNALRGEDPPPDVYEKIESIASGVPAGSGGVIFTPWLNGERTPVDDHALRGGFHNISTTTTMSHFVRAVMEGVAYNSRWVLGHVEKFTGRRMDPLNIIGGGAQSPQWCRIYADVLGRTIRQVENPLQANARGAAFIASVALGHISFDDIPDLVKISEIYEPDPGNEKIYNEYFREFLNIHKNNRAMYRRMNSHQ